MKAICKRELRALLRGLRGWGYVAVVLLAAAVAVLLTNLIQGDPRFEINAYYIAWGMIPATAILTADCFQAERRECTERLLYSLPVSNTGIVLGKLLASFVPVFLAGAGLCLFPLFMSLFGPVPRKAAAALIAALVFMGMSFNAVGVFISACSRRRWTAALLTVAVLGLSWAAPYAANFLEMVSHVTLPMMLCAVLLAGLIVWSISGSAVLATIAAALVEIPMLLAYLRGSGEALMGAVAQGVGALSLFRGLDSFMYGLLDGRRMISWLAATALFAFLTVLYLANRRQAKRRSL